MNNEPINRIIFSGMQLLSGSKWVTEQALIVEDKKIKAIIPKDMIKHHLPAQQFEFPADCYLAPGFIDLHIHGINGHDVMDGTKEALSTIAKTLAAQGVTGFLATTMSSSDKAMEKVFEAVLAESANEEGAAILGIHLEGPFIAETKRGAHSISKLPDIALFNKWQGLAQDAIKIVTLAPELPGALDFIKSITKSGVVASIGHTNATFAEVMEAIQAGCTQATHLYNAMSPIQQREPGAAGALLLTDTIKAELIVDGHHLHPVIIQLTLKIKNKNDLLLVTDSMRAACLGDGEYDLGGQKVYVHDGEARLADGTLAGSTLCMNQAVKNMTGFSRCSLIDAIQMASTNPANVLRLEEKKGSIGVGKEADLVLLSKDLDVLLTMRGGKVIYQRDTQTEQDG